MHLFSPSSTKGARPVTRRGRKEGNKGGSESTREQVRKRDGRKRRRAIASSTSSPLSTNLQEFRVGPMKLGVDAIMMLGKGRRTCRRRGSGNLLHRLPLPLPLLSPGVGRLTLTRRRQGSDSHGGGSGCCQQGKEGWRLAATTAGAMAAAGSAAAGGSNLMMEVLLQNVVKRPPSHISSSHCATGLAERRQGQRHGHDAHGLWLCVYWGVL